MYIQYSPFTIYLQPLILPLMNRVHLQCLSHIISLNQIDESIVLSALKSMYWLYVTQSTREPGTIEWHSFKRTGRHF